MAMKCTLSEEQIKKLIDSSDMDGKESKLATNILEHKFIDSFKEYIRRAGEKYEQYQQIHRKINGKTRAVFFCQLTVAIKEDCKDDASPQKIHRVGCGFSKKIAKANAAQKLINILKTRVYEIQLWARFVTNSRDFEEPPLTARPQLSTYYDSSSLDSSLEFFICIRQFKYNAVKRSQIFETHLCMNFGTKIISNRKLYQQKF